MARGFPVAVLADVREWRMSWYLYTFLDMNKDCFHSKGGGILSKPFKYIDSNEISEVFCNDNFITGSADLLEKAANQHYQFTMLGV
jgi:hypothetical protein